MSASTSTAAKPNYWLSAVAIVLFAVVFLVPFAFIVLTAVKTQQDVGAAGLLLAGPVAALCRTCRTCCRPATTS